ncbi:MAG: DnaJ domain-containing protein [Gammaproteobacteria bacterium]|nr:DnaJ domain-containing protein [Gammaproteobacteria bacterium]MBU1725000.1 DnaJ domain-containing protein [Gammaproteobacteria bacterium]MBU2005074.1 DnaJ domain-containing protein [Gammaproteobacteria bacterium]
MEYKDYYKILGVERSASQDDIRKAFRRMAAKYHPDRNKDAGAEDHFKEINEANEVLGDPEKRTRYDQLGNNWHTGENFRPPPDWAGSNSGHFNASFFEDIARQGFDGSPSGGFSDFFESLFGNSSAGFRKPPGGGFHRGSAPQEATIQLTLEDIFHGARKTIRLPSGESLQVQIPVGIAEGQKLRLTGKGPRGSDIYLKIKLREHPLYRLDGKDIHMELPITPWEAALGETVAVPTPTGRINLKIPQGSQSGKKMRLKARGLPGQPAGDLFVTLLVNTPPADTAEQKEYYARMKTLFDWNPRQHIA